MEDNTIMSVSAHVKEPAENIAKEVVVEVALIALEEFNLSVPPLESHSTILATFVVPINKLPTMDLVEPSLLILIHSLFSLPKKVLRTTLLLHFLPDKFWPTVKNIYMNSREKRI